MLRIRTKRPMMRRIVENSDFVASQSYLGPLQHGNEHKIEMGIE